MPTITIQEAGRRLQQNAIATSLSINKWGVSKPLTNEQKQTAAEPFGARVKRLSASKKLVNLKHPRYQAVTQLCGKVKKYWESVTLPYVEKDKRLLRADREEAFDVMILTFGRELMEAADKLQEVRSEIIEEAREMLGDLFDARDYPADLSGQYSVVVSKPQVEPPAYLETVNPEEYQRRLEQFQLQMQQTVVLAEQALADEMAKMVHGLAERLGTDETGRPKTFKSSSLQQLREFFDRFKELKVRDGDALDNVVREAQELLNGHSPSDIRQTAELRAEIHAGMERITEQLVPLITPKARRRLRVQPGVSELIEA